MVTIKMYFYSNLKTPTSKKLLVSILSRFSEYLGDEHNDIAFLCCRIGQSCAKLSRLPEAKQFLERANKIYKHVPGTSHPFYQNEFHPLLKFVMQ